MKVKELIIDAWQDFYDKAEEVEECLCPEEYLGVQIPKPRYTKPEIYEAWGPLDAADFAMEHQDRNPRLVIIGSGIRDTGVQFWPDDNT